MKGTQPGPLPDGRDSANRAARVSKRFLREVWG